MWVGAIIHGANYTCSPYATELNKAEYSTAASFRYGYINLISAQVSGGYISFNTQAKTGHGYLPPLHPYAMFTSAIFSLNTYGAAHSTSIAAYTQTLMSDPWI